MSALVFLLIALALSIGGSVVLWMRHRKPSSLEHTIDAFSRERIDRSTAELADERDAVRELGLI